VCQAYGIPHSHFLGGPPEWTALDRDKAIWHRTWKQGFCQGCGTHPDEWNKHQGGDLFAYTPEELLCRGCQVLESAQRQFQKHPHKSKIPGLSVRLVRTPEGEADGESAGSGPGQDGPGVAEPVPAAETSWSGGFAERPT
jgi:hypothetical protein